MVYRCKKCSFIHEGEMPDGYFCPLCFTNLFDFELIKEETEKIYNRKTIAEENPSINRTEEKCTNCGACSKICENVVGIKRSKDCLYCGKCILSCPTGAMTPKYNYREVWELINVPSKTVVAITAPAVRVGIGDAFSFPPGEFLEGKMIAGLKSLGFDYVFDVSFGADLTAMEEGAELQKRLEEGKNLPIITSCCPSWVEYAKLYHKKLKKNLSSCKSPIGMQVSILREVFAKEEEIADADLIIVAITPCPAKKHEIIDTECDYVLTTRELGHLLREQNIDFKNLVDEKFDSLTGSSSGTIFGTSGGVMLSALRCLYHFGTGNDLTDEKILIKEHEFYKEYSIKVNKDIIRAAYVDSMLKFEQIMPLIKDFHLIEVMNCEGGCITGGGQIVMPIKDMPELIQKRREALLSKDKKAKIRYPYQNEGIISLYDDYLDEPLSEKSLEILHK